LAFAAFEEEEEEEEDDDDDDPFESNLRFLDGAGPATAEDDAPFLPKRAATLAWSSGLSPLKPRWMSEGLLMVEKEKQCRCHHRVTGNSPN
jgi:hypothetical protein